MDFSSLPIDLVAGIFHRWSLKSLGKLKSMCKEWNDLINQEWFIYDHLDHHSHEVLLRTEYDQKVYIMDPETEVLSDSPIPDEFRDRYTIDNMVHCDGLMLCVCVPLNGAEWLRYEDAKLVIWNPILRTSKWIDMMTRYSVDDIVGIGYDNQFRENYKILHHPGSHRDDKPYSDDCKIYEKNKSDSWRTIGAMFNGQVAVNCEGECVKGNMYWIVEKIKDQEYKGQAYEGEEYKGEEKVGESVIISFDFSTETYKEVCICPPNGLKRIRSFNGEALSLYRQNDYTSNVQVWVTNRLSDEVVTFNIYVQISHEVLLGYEDRDFLRAPGYSIADSEGIKVMAWCELDAAGSRSINFFKFNNDGIVYANETKIFAEGELFNSSVLARCCMFVPSLVPVESKKTKKYPLPKTKKYPLLKTSTIFLVLFAAVPSLAYHLLRKRLS